MKHINIKNLMMINIIIAMIVAFYTALCRSRHSEQVSIAHRDQANFFHEQVITWELIKDSHALMMSNDETHSYFKDKYNNAIDKIRTYKKSEEYHIYLQNKYGFFSRHPYLFVPVDPPNPNGE